MQDLVSIIVPTYNRGHLIAETIQSVLNQSYQNWELIIVDDGSNDETKGRVEEFKDIRLKYYFIEHTGVIGAVRNVGMSHARGAYIAFLDSDDLWLPDKLDYQLSFLRKNPESSFVFGHGEHFGSGATPTPELENFFVGKVFIFFLFEKRFIFYVPTLLFKKEVLNKISTIDESLFYAGDIDFFLRMAYSFKGIFSNNIVTRIRKGDKSHSQSNELNAYDEYLLMLNKHRCENRLTSKQFSQLASEHHYRLGLIYFDLEKSKKARKEFLNHIQLNPLSWKGWIRLVQSFFKSE
jgi:glycosyltransferase involved in cell wall biosynthesis